MMDPSLFSTPERQEYAQSIISSVAKCIDDLRNHAGDLPTEIQAMLASAGTAFESCAAILCKNHAELSAGSLVDAYSHVAVINELASELIQIEDELPSSLLTDSKDPFNREKMPKLLNETSSFEYLLYELTGLSEDAFESMDEAARETIYHEYSGQFDEGPCNKDTGLAFIEDLLNIGNMFASLKRSCVEFNVGRESAVLGSLRFTPKLTE